MNRSSPLPGLYIHIPFCRSKCPYCSFYSETALEKIPDFLEALFLEMESYRNRFGPFDTLYVGGGTPSVLTARQIEKILTRVRLVFTVTDAAEITVEVNPADATPGFIAPLFQMGVNRLNVGIQSFDENTLGFLGRRHSPAQALSAIKASEKAGFENIGIDLMYGLPGQDLSYWYATLRQAIAFNIPHLSCYQLTLEPRTPLGIAFANGQLTLPVEETALDFFLNTSEILTGKGYEHYEVSNFARGDAFLSRHNRKYWDHTPYLGLGPAAHSFCDKKRWWNKASVDGYMHCLADGLSPVEASEILTAEQLCFEALFLGLRTAQGIDMDDFSARHGAHIWFEKREMLSILEKEGLVRISDGRLRPTLRGLALADSLALM